MQHKALSNKYYLEGKVAYLENEEWRGVVGYEKDYMVSNLGRVISNRCSKQRILKGSMLNGYPCVTMMHDSGQTTYQTHRLVASAFLQRPEGIYVVNHKDGNKSNNHVSNLEWCTYSENNIHALYTGLKSQIRAVVCEKKDRSIGYFFPSQAVAVSSGFNQTNISGVCLGKKKTHHGFRWWFANKEAKENDPVTCACR